MNSDDELTILLVLLCLVLGYGIVSLAIRGISKLTKRNTAAPSDARQLRTASNDVVDRERQCRHILGVSSGGGEAEIKAAYHQLLAKYDPKQISALGEEFYDLASARTRSINEAYEYLSQHHGFK